MSAKRVGYGILGLACARYALLHWTIPACADTACMGQAIAERDALAAIAGMYSFVFLTSAVLPPGEVQQGIAEVADWVFTATVSLLSVAGAVATGLFFAPIGYALPFLTLVFLPFLARKALRFLRGSPYS
jgi:hypothetical protein